MPPILFFSSYFRRFVVQDVL
jgi:magnesium-transporting ATPase (P-type)